MVASQPGGPRSTCGCDEVWFEATAEAALGVQVDELGVLYDWAYRAGYPNDEDAKDDDEEPEGSISGDEDRLARIFRYRL